MKINQVLLLIATLGSSCLGGYWLAPAISSLPISMLVFAQTVGVVCLFASYLSLITYLGSNLNSPADIDPLIFFVFFVGVGCLYLDIPLFALFVSLPYVVVQPLHFLGETYNNAKSIESTYLKLLAIGFSLVVELANMVAPVCAIFLMIWFSWTVSSPCILLCFVLNTILMHCLKSVRSANRMLIYRNSFETHHRNRTQIVVALPLRPQIYYPLDTPFRLLSDYCAFIFKGLFLSTSFTQYLFRNAFIDMLHKKYCQTSLHNYYVNTFETLWPSGKALSDAEIYELVKLFRYCDYHFRNNNEQINEVLSITLKNVSEQCHALAEENGQTLAEENGQIQPDDKLAERRSNIIKEFKHFYTNEDCKPVHLMLPSLVIRLHNRSVISMMKVLDSMRSWKLPPPVQLEIISYLESIPGMVVGNPLLYTRSCFLSNGKAHTRTLRQYVKQNHPNENVPEVLLLG